MKTAVVLRHAERQDRSDNASHLSPLGIEQARKARSGFERFDMVVTSPLPRAVETAVAMGFAVTRTHPGIQEIGERILDHVGWNEGYTAWAAARHEVPVVHSYVEYVGSLLGDWLEELPDGGSLLVIAHGGIVEALATGLCGDASWTTPGASAGYAEGFVALLDADHAPRLSPITA